MSEVLEEFVKPYSEGMDTVTSFRGLVLLGIVAWNASLLPEPARSRMLDDVVANATPPGTSSRLEMRNLLEHMIERKFSEFPETMRAIIAANVTKARAGFHLVVTSRWFGEYPRSLRT
jgi:hypothetical protein